MCIDNLDRIGRIISGEPPDYSGEFPQYPENNEGMKNYASASNSARFVKYNTR